ncbi:hypothetical protein [Streptomyces sp. NPDC088847]|uniref:hypothetical protein n=1 Tax=Streptomyces sp. NPDC088847 TaxID=3365909 RepID=UPI0037F50DAF
MIGIERVIGRHPPGNQNEPCAKSAVGGAPTITDGVEHVFARMETWKILCDSCPTGDGVRDVMQGITRRQNLPLAE